MDEARWDELYGRLTDVLALASERWFRGSEPLRDLLGVSSARRIIEGWYVDADVLKARMLADPQIFGQYKDGFVDREKSISGQSGSFSDFVKMLEEGIAAELWLPREAGDEFVDSLRAANAKLARFVEWFRARVEELVLRADLSDPSLPQRYDRAPPTTDEVLAYLLEMRKFLGNTATKQDRRHMRQFFSPKQFERGIQSLAYALGIPVEEAYSFVRHASPEPGITGRYSYDPKRFVPMKSSKKTLPY